ncbi:hypothetical protein [Burkholderia sp. JKS000303]|uniref:hypothetical protein n=1 Tax=Burkholderia sp. JKS000303 TaxID=1938747 RepID=UPI000C014163|nr:hypothetical protein [Burkholderia sp. JKS000303]PFH12840.1 hypothetical protein BX604_7260 [Burkholderia sp. JKS000303]
MAGGPLNQDFINSMPNFAVPGISTPRNIAVGQPSSPPAPAPQMGNLIDQMRVAGQLPQMAGYGAQPAMPPRNLPLALQGVIPANAAPAPQSQSAQAFVNSLPTFHPPAAASQQSLALKGIIPEGYTSPAQWNVPPLPAGMPGGSRPALSPSDIAGQGTWATGANMAPSAGVSGGGAVGGKFIDPAAAIQAGFDQQTAYRQQAIQDIMAAARQGDPGNYSFRLAHLVGATGANNFAGIQGQGVDALNSAIAGITGAGIGANAAMYGADQATVRTGMEVGEQHYQAATGSVPTGTVVGSDPSTKMAVPLTTYGQRPSVAGMVPMQYDPTPPSTMKPVVGKTYVDKSGNVAVYQSDGTYKKVGQ